MSLPDTNVLTDKWGGLQFSHKIPPGGRNGRYSRGRTFALRAPTVEKLQQAALELFQGAEKVELDVDLGIARLHPKDLYSREAGRLTAVANLKTERLALTGVTVQSKDYVYYLSGDGFSIRLRLVKGTKQPYIYGAWDYKRTL